MAAKQKQGKGSGKTPKHSPSDMTQAQRTAHNKQRKLKKAAAAKCNAAAKRLRAEYKQLAAITELLATAAKHGARISMLPDKHAQKLAQIAVQRIHNQRS